MPVKILHFSTHNENCGIGKYQEMFLEAMASDENVQNKFFDVSPNQTKRMSKDELAVMYKNLKEELVEYDVLHIQHEFSFYVAEELYEVCKIAKKLHKKLIITYHTSPDVVIKNVRRTGLHPRSILHYVRQKRHADNMARIHIEPAKLADVVIAHNKHTLDSLISLGIPAKLTRELFLPVPTVKSYNAASTQIHENLPKNDGDVVYCTIGFMHRYKGIADAVKALSYLPANYKLAIIGGIHPESNDSKIYNDICDLIVERSLTDRVYITGFVQDDDELNKLIRECDLCIYPYDGEYYARVSSAALNLAFSNNMPVVAYPVETFRELNKSSGVMDLTNGFSYYELAKTIKQTDLPVLAEKSKVYAVQNSYSLVNKDLLSIYQSLIS